MFAADHPPQQNQSALGALKWGVSWLRPRSLQRPGRILIVLILICLAKGFVGAGPIRAYTHDSFATMDGAWRVWNGQRPYADFYSDPGPLALIPITLAMNFSQGVAAINWGICFLGIIVALAAVPVVFGRLSAHFATLYCSSLVLLAIAPFPMGEVPTMGSQGMFYNRSGYALLGVLLVECVCTLRDNTRRHGEFLGGVTAGVAWAIGLFVKFTYGVLGVILVCATLRLRQQTRGRWLGIALGLFAIGTPVLIFLRFDVVAIIDWLRYMGTTRHVDLLLLVEKSFLATPLLASVMAFGAATAMILRRSGFSRLGRKLIWVLLISGSIDLAALATNNVHQVAEFRFSALAIILLVDGLAASVRAQESHHLSQKVLLVWGITFAVSFPVLDLGGLTVSVVRPLLQRSRFPQQRIAAAVPDVMIAAEYSKPGGNSPFIEQLNDGIVLLQHDSKPTEKVAAFLWANPFPYLLRRPPARGGSLSYDYGANFNDHSSLSGDFAFGGADVVMVPKFLEDGSPQLVPHPILAIYGPFLASHFVPVGESRFWLLYRHVR